MITRRTFVKSGACALVALAAPPRFLLRAVEAAAGRRKVLVAIFQRGAVDGLSMVPPYGDVAYAAVRPGIAIQPPSHGESERAVDLDGFFAFHPSLAPLLPLWRNRALAVVHACGSPDTTRSHFDAQDYMETGTPGVKSTPDGWLARAANALPEPASPLRAVALGPALPRILCADVGGWDTHVGQGNERGQLANRLRELAAALAAFTQDLGDRMADVAVLTMSEFGRTVAENGNRGTDHGHATAMLVIGGGVRGGKVYGRWPGLAQVRLHEGRDLAVTTDFRALFTEVAARHLGVPAGLFPGWAQPASLIGLFG